MQRPGIGAQTEPKRWQVQAREKVEQTSRAQRAYLRGRPTLVYSLAIRRNVRRDWLIYAVIGLYGFMVAAVAAWEGATQLFSPFIYLEKWIRPVAPLLAVALTSAALVSFRHRAAPLQSFLRATRRMFPPAKAASALMFLALAIFHGLFTSMKNLMNRLAQFSFDPVLAQWDQKIHFVDPWRLLPMWEPLTRFFQFQYVLAWLTLLAGVSCYATMFARRSVRDQYIWTFLICWILLGNVMASAVMSAGPVYYAEVVGSDRFQPLLDYLAFSAGSPVSSVHLQEMLWARYTTETLGMGSGISAFPSLHLSMATLWTLVAFRISRRLGAVMVAFTLITQIASVHLGWHYAIDGYFSIVATVAIWKLVGHFQTKATDSRIFTEPLVPSVESAYAPFPVGRSLQG